MRAAIALAREGISRSEGGPFGAIIVRGDEIIGHGNNRVTSTNDPTSHAEIVAIRNACNHLGSFQLTGCELYTSCEPCPMCLGAIYWARPDKVYYAASRADAADAGFDDDLIYREINIAPPLRRIAMEQFLSTEAKDLFREWLDKEDRVQY